MKPLKLPRPKSNQNVKLAKPVEDAVFVRRVYLDVVGLLPTAAEMAAFEARGYGEEEAREEGTTLLWS